jgi:16S rRNA (cytosine967-C5)-methyltransferase
VNDPYRPRRSAAIVLGRVVRSGAYSNVLLRKGLDNLDIAELARTRALVYGTLRILPAIDRLLESGSGRNLEKIEAGILDILRIAAFEITSSDVPNPVAVSVGVDLVKEQRPRASGMANAILHRVAEVPETEMKMELPDWMTELLSRIWNTEAMTAFAAASSAEAPRIGRLRSGEPGRSTAVSGVNGAYELPPGPVQPNFIVQDAASIAVGNALAVEPGMRVLDLAAAPGGKTLHLLDLVGSTGIVVAADSHRRRVKSAASRVPEASWVRADAGEPPFRSGSFDRVLLDAPCSGLGTLRRRPEILYRTSPDAVSKLRGQQRRMLEAAMPLVADGGRLIYSVCTVTPEETLDVVNGLGTEAPDGIGEDLGSGRLLAPHTTATDGMFIARWNN